MHGYDTMVKAGLMLKNVLALTIVAMFTTPALAQSTSHPEFFDHAVLQHGGPAATVTANFPVPLIQAISAIREEYGWRIDWEEAPCYSRFDVVDDTGPKWRAAHPDAKGVTRRAGGLFASTFPEPAGASTAGESDALAKVIGDYNSTDNPGKYSLRLGADGQFAVVGTRVRDETGALREVRPLLDTPLTIEKKARSAYDTVSAILLALSWAAGKNVIVMSVPNNLFRDAEVTVGGNKVAARRLLREALDSTHRPLLYNFGFDPDYNSGTYILNVLVAVKAEDGELGGRRLVPIDRHR